MTLNSAFRRTEKFFDSFERRRAGVIGRSKPTLANLSLLVSASSPDEGISFLLLFNIPLRASVPTIEVGPFPLLRTHSTNSAIGPVGVLTIAATYLILGRSVLDQTRNFLREQREIVLIRGWS